MFFYAGSRLMAILSNLRTPMLANLQHILLLLYL